MKFEGWFLNFSYTGKPKKGKINQNNNPAAPPKTTSPIIKSPTQKRVNRTIAPITTEIKLKVNASNFFWRLKPGEVSATTSLFHGAKRVFNKRESEKK